MASEWPRSITDLREDADFVVLVEKYVEVRGQHRKALAEGLGQDRMLNLDGARRAAHNRAANYLVERELAPGLVEGRELVKCCANALSGE